MMKITRLLALAILCVVGGLAHAADVSGTWTASFDTQVGKQEYTYILKVEGAALSGTAKSNLVGDEIRFKRELMGFPAEEFVAKRSK